MKQPLIASLIPIDQTLTVDLFSRWCNGRAVLWSTAGKLSDLWSRRSWPQISFSVRAIIARPFLRLWLFLCLPWLHLLSWRRLAKLVKQQQIDGLICLSWLDKILLTQPALWLRLPVIWLQLPEDSELKLFAPLSTVYRHQANRAKLISYIPQSDDGRQLGDGINEQRLLPALDQAGFCRQADLFDSLADGQRQQVESKYFVVGAVVDLDNSQAVEILLRSLKIVLSVIPSVQLVIIGDGAKRKELQWLAKQLDLANLVWFVGRQEPLDKWFRSLDALIELSITTSGDWYRLLQAMAAGLPIIAPKNRLTTDFLLPGQTAMIVEKPEPEMIAQAVIQLQQDKMLAGRLSWHSRQWIAEFGNLERQLIDFTNYLA